MKTLALIAFAIGLAVGTLAALGLRQSAPSWGIREPEDGLALFLLCGQSNMAGVGAIEPWAVEQHAGIYVFGNDYRWHAAQEPLDRSVGQVDAVSDDGEFPGVGPGYAFAIRLKQLNPNLRIGLIPCAKVGSSMSEWTRSLSDQSLYGSSVKRALAASTHGTVAGLVFFQGERDAWSAEEASQWSQRFERFVQDLRSDLNAPLLPVVFAQIGSNGNAKRYPAWQEMQQAQAAVRSPGVAMVKTDDLHRADFVHFTTPSYREIGRRQAEAMNVLLRARE